MVTIITKTKIRAKPLATIRFKCPACHESNIAANQDGWVYCSNLDCGYGFKAERFKNVTGVEKIEKIRGAVPTLVIGV